MSTRPKFTPLLSNTFVLRCKIYYAAMHISELFWHLVYVNSSYSRAATCCVSRKRTIMSKTAAFGRAPSATLFGRLMTVIDRLLMASAAIAIRNDDPPYFGL